MAKDKKPYKRTQGKAIHELSDEKRMNAAKEMTIEEWNAKLEEKRNSKTGKAKGKKQYKKTQGKIIHGSTPEERFKEKYGMTIEEWRAKKFKEKTGMTTDEWLLNRYKSIPPIDFLKELQGSICSEDEKLVKALQELGLNDGVINVLLGYASAVSRSGLFLPLVREMGKSWLNNNIGTIEQAIVYAREEHEKNKY